MSDIIVNYDEAWNALRKARAITVQIYSTNEKDPSVPSMKVAAEAADEYLAVVEQHMRRLVEAAQRLSKKPQP